MTKEYILLAEDNPNEVFLAQRAFQKCHLSDSLVVVWDGEEVLDFLFCRRKYASRDPEHSPAVILLDLKLPYLNGLEVLQQIRADNRTRHLPVVVLTSSAEEKDMTESYRLGANNFVRKPTNFEQFVESMKQISAYWIHQKG
jgi:two-component system, response regulator